MSKQIELLKKQEWIEKKKYLYDWLKEQRFNLKPPVANLLEILIDCSNVKGISIATIPTIIEKLNKKFPNSTKRAATIISYLNILLAKKLIKRTEANHWHGSTKTKLLTNTKTLLSANLNSCVSTGSQKRTLRTTNLLAENAQTIQKTSNLVDYSIRPTMPENTGSLPHELVEPDVRKAHPYHISLSEEIYDIERNDFKSSFRLKLNEGFEQNENSNPPCSENAPKLHYGVTLGAATAAAGEAAKNELLSKEEARRRIRNLKDTLRIGSRR